MNENLNLVEILKGCPVGTEFYSSIYGKVLFIGIDKGNPIEPILVKINVGIDKLKRFTKQGRYYAIAGECVIFPSKDQRDWAKFERFWDKPKPKIEKISSEHSTTF